jgi:hypothetical protein
MSQVFQELGLDMQGKLNAPPRSASSDPVTEDELDARLNRLRAP